MLQPTTVHIAEFSASCTRTAFPALIVWIQSSDYDLNTCVESTLQQQTYYQYANGSSYWTSMKSMHKPQPLHEHTVTDDGSITTAGT